MIVPYEIVLVFHLAYTRTRVWVDGFFNIKRLAFTFAIFWLNENGFFFWVFVRSCLPYLQANRIGNRPNSRGHKTFAKLTALRVRTSDPYVVGCARKGWVVDGGDGGGGYAYSDRCRLAPWYRRPFRRVWRPRSTGRAKPPPSRWPPTTPPARMGPCSGRADVVPFGVRAAAAAARSRPATTLVGQDARYFAAVQHSRATHPYHHPPCPCVPPS